MYVQYVCFNLLSDGSGSRRQKHIKDQFKQNNPNKMNCSPNFSLQEDATFNISH